MCLCKPLYLALALVSVREEILARILASLIMLFRKCFMAFDLSLSVTKNAFLCLNAKFLPAESNWHVINANWHRSLCM